MVDEESKFRKRLGTFLNISIVVFILALAAVLAKTYIFTSEPKVIKVGDRISLSNVSLEKDKQSVLLFLRSDCIYCTKSADFYKDLSKALAQSANTRLIAVFSKNDDRATEYLSELGLTELNSIHASYGELGIAGTPTLALVNDAGMVKELWKGKLSRKQEIEIKKNLSIPADDWYIEESELDVLKKSGQKVTIIDVQDRDFYAKNHFIGAKNIPLDELSVRGTNELSLTDIIVVYGISEKDGDYAQEVLARDGFVKVYILDYKFQNPNSQLLAN